MNFAEIKEGIELFKTYAHGRVPGAIVAKALAYTNNLVMKHKWPSLRANLMANLIVQSGYANYDGMWLKLTDKGYAMVNGEISLALTPDFKQLCIGPDRKADFYTVWELIGNEKEINPLYVSGPEFFETVKPYVGLNAWSYKDYMDHLRDNGEDTLRRSWCKDLFCKVTDVDYPNFLDNLSHLLDLRAPKAEAEPVEEIEVINPFENRSNAMAEPKQPLIFISHNSEDKDFAEALIDLIEKIGVKSEDIFCSSVPGYGIGLRQNIFDTIKDKYDNYDLIVLFMHSPRFYQSPVSLCEMGACWISRKEYFSFLTKDCAFAELRGVVTNQDIAIKVDTDDASHLLNEFKEKIEGIFSLSPIKSIIWERARDKFLNSVNN